MRKLENEADNKLFSIDTDNNKRWREHFPPMPTKRYNTAAVTTSQHLIVAGGETMQSYLDTVEVMDVESLLWSTVASLPHPYSQAVACASGRTCIC